VRINAHPIYANQSAFRIRALYDMEEDRSRKQVDDDLHGAHQAWKLFRSEMLDDGSLPVLAHVRFPLGAMHMVLLTEDTAMIRSHLPQIWEMLTRVDLSKVSAGETQYLMA